MATFTEMETDERQRSIGNFGYNSFMSSGTTYGNQLDFSSSMPYTSSSYPTPTEEEEEIEAKIRELDKEIERLEKLLNIEYKPFRR